MKKNKKAETLAWLLVSAIILAIIIMWIVVMIDSQTQNSNFFEKNMEEKILKRNIINLTKNISTKGINNWETFYIESNWWNISFKKNKDKEIKNFSLEDITDPNYNKDKYKISLVKTIIEWVETISDINIEKIN